jgi:cellulose synthase operon protein C
MSRRVLLTLLALIALAGCDVFVSPQQRVDRAAELIESGDYRAAAIELRNALKKEPDNSRGRLLLARTEFWAGDVRASERDLKRAVDAGANVAETVRLDAEIKKTLGQYDALATLAGKPRSGLQEYERLMFLGYAQLGLKHVDAARASFDAAVKVAPTGRPSTEARSAQAAGLLAAGNVQGALTVLDSVLASQPDYRPAALAKANVLLQRGEYADAERILATLNAGDGQSKLNVAERVSVLGSLSEARLGQHKLLEAEQSVGQLAGLVPDSWVAAYMQGRLALAQGKGPDAITDLQRAVRGAPAFLPARVMLGLAYLGQGNAAQAEAEFRQVLDAAPDNLEVRKLLAQAQIRQGRADSAAEVLAPALAADVGDPAIYALAGRARLMQGDREEGDALLERGLAGTPDDPKLRLEMAGAYLAAGDAGRALELVASIPDDVGGETKKQIQFLGLASGRDKAAAKLEVEALIKRNPADVRLLNLAAAWLAYLGDIGGSRTWLVQALATAPSDAQTLVNLGRLEMTAGRNNEALKAFNAALASDPKNGDAFLALIAMAERSGDNATAARRIADWSNADPKAAQPRLLLARAAFRDGNPVQGQKLIDEALKMAPNSAPSAPLEGAAGQLLIEAGLYDEALGHFRKAIDLDARDPGYPLGAARAQLALGRREAARESLNRALAVRPNWVPAAVLLAQLELTEKRVDAALALAEGFKKDPAGGGAYIGFLLEGDIRLSVGQAALAAKAYAESAKLRPSTQAAIGESRARRAARLPQPADPLVAWLDRDPGDAEVRLELAQTYQASDALDDAVREYERVLTAQPNSLIALNNLAGLYGRLGDPRGEALARRALAGAPQSGPVADTLGWILLQSGNSEESLKILKQAHDLDKKNPEIEYHLGAALLKVGQTAAARQALEQAIAAGQSSPWVSDAQRLLDETG